MNVKRSVQDAGFHDEHHPREQAKHDVDESIDTMFAAVLGKPLPAASLPATTRLFARLDETEGAVISATKNGFKRVRPYLSNPEIKPLVRPSVTGSYPSGHTTHVTAAAIIISQMVPEKRDSIWQPTLPVPVYGA